MSERTKQFSPDQTIPTGGFPAQLVLAMPVDLNEAVQCTVEEVNGALEGVIDAAGGHATVLSYASRRDPEETRVDGATDIASVFVRAAELTDDLPVVVIVVGEFDLYAGDMISAFEPLHGLLHAGVFVQYWQVGNGKLVPAWRELASSAEHCEHGNFGVVYGRDAGDYPRGADAAAAQLINWLSS